MCRALEPAIEALGRDPLVGLRDLRRGRATPTPGRPPAIPGSPFAVAVDADGTVLAKGTFNTAGAARVRRSPPARSGGAHERRRGAASSAKVRRASLDRRVTGARTRRRARRARRGRGLPLLRPHLHDRLLPAPDRAAADRLHGLPLRANDGHRVDDLGRLVDARRRAGRRGRRAAHRRRRPSAARRPAHAGLHGGRRAVRHSRTQIDGAWYRCCGGPRAQARRLLLPQPPAHQRRPRR